MVDFEIKILKDWFSENKRELPWRETCNPYAIWISEVMLQQTQVSVVIPYYLRWMERFPTIRQLAESDIDDVIKHWEGLGYYSRARNLHEGARYLVAHHNAQIPNEKETLSKIKGLGPYTTGAILSFAFHQKAAAVDGNVLRVLARYFALEDDIAKQATNKKFRTLIESILPDHESWIINEALIELGATICQRKAQCSKCPLQGSCQAFKCGRIAELPIKTKGPKTTHLHRSVAVIQCNQKFLVRRGKKGEVMEDLYEFPFFNKEESMDISQLIKERFALRVESTKQLPDVSHSFTRYQVRLEPTLITVWQTTEIPDFSWVSTEELMSLSFSSGHRRIFQSLFPSQPH